MVIKIKSLSLPGIKPQSSSLYIVRFCTVHTELSWVINLEAREINIFIGEVKNLYFLLYLYPCIEAYWWDDCQLGNMNVLGFQQVMCQDQNMLTLLFMFDYQSSLLGKNYAKSYLWNKNFIHHPKTFET